jgi:hypothetical protein
MSPSLSFRGSIVLAALLGALGCDGTISVTFFTGVQEFEVSTADLGLPTALRDASGNIATVSCGTVMCPPSAPVPLTCAGGACDPAPVTLSGPVGSVIDIDMLLAESREVGVRRVESYDIEEVAYEVATNTLTLDIGPVEIHWGPEAATAIDPALGVQRFGTVPVIAAGSTPRGQMQLDSAGVDALSDYLVRTGTRIRFFARTTVDLAPGDRFPEGMLRIGVNATLTAVGRVIE